MSYYYVVDAALTAAGLTAEDREEVWREKA